LIIKSIFTAFDIMSFRTFLIFWRGSIN
jgi:hypothetical protein